MSEPVALLPCPFCGSPAKFEYEHFRFFVSCHHCGFDQGERDNKKAAIDAWNRRTHPPSERVRELLEAALQFDHTYNWHWDRADGAAVVMPDRVPDLEARYARLSSALAAFQQDTALPAIAAEGLKEGEA